MKIRWDIVFDVLGILHLVAAFLHFVVGNKSSAHTGFIMGLLLIILSNQNAPKVGDPNP
jgi:hypothetical protein